MRRWVLLGVLSFCLIGTTGAAWTFFKLAKTYYTQEALSRLRPTGSPADVRLSRESEGTHLVFLGDSRASMWPDPDWDGHRFSNFGIPRQTTSQVRLRTDDAIARSEADIYVLQAGINDLMYLHLFKERRDEIVRDCIENLTATIESLKQTEATVVVVSIFPCGDVPLKRRPLWSEDITTGVREVNAAISEIPDVIWLDSWALLDNGTSRVRDEFQLDHLHLNRAAYEALNAELADLLEVR